MIIRMFDTALDPEDVDRGKELFRTQVAPAFRSFPGCVGIEMVLGIEQHSGGLVDIASISRWESREAVDRAVATEEYGRALAELKKLFQQNPIVRHFEVVG